jgi:hypothetical protein
MTFQDLMQLLQTVSILIAILIGVGTLRGRSDDKNTLLVEMRKDIEQIKKDTACLPNQGNMLMQHQYALEELQRRVNALEKKGES